MSHPVPPPDRARRCVVLHNNDYEAAHDAEGLPPSVEADAEVAATAASVVDALRARGWWAEILTVADRLDGLADALAARAPDVVFNLVESLARDATREAEVPILLAELGYPTTGNPPPALRLANAKDRSRGVLADAGVPVPAGLVIHEAGALPADGHWPLAFPLFVKPARTDASIGIDQGSVVRTPTDAAARVAWLLGSVGGPVLVEEYVPGAEINVAVFPEPRAGHVVPTRIDFSGYPPGYAPIVTYDCKWRHDSLEYCAMSHPCRDELGPELLAEVERVARAAFVALGLDAYGRVDMRLDANGRPRVIDVNPNCDIHPEAGICVAAASAGVSHESLVEQIALHALERSSR